MGNAHVLAYDALKFLVQQSKSDSTRFASVGCFERKTYFLAKWPTINLCCKHEVYGEKVKWMRKTKIFSIQKSVNIIF